MISRLTLNLSERKIDYSDKKNDLYEDELQVFNLYDVEIRINDKELISNRTVDFIALHLSYLAEETSYHYIYNCSCGEPGCAGIWSDIKVSKEEDTITWHFDKSLYQTIINKEVRDDIEVDLDDYVITFDKKQYADEIKKMLEKIKEKRSESDIPGLLCISSGLVEDDVLNYEEWIKVALENEYFYKDENEEEDGDDYE